MEQQGATSLDGQTRSGRDVEGDNAKAKHEQSAAPRPAVGEGTKNGVTEKEEEEEAKQEGILEKHSSEDMTLQGIPKATDALDLLPISRSILGTDSSLE